MEGRPLYEEPQIGQMLFGHLELDFERIVAELRAGRLPSGRWWPESPSRLVERLAVLDGQQKAWLKEAERRRAEREDQEGEVVVGSSFDSLAGPFQPSLGEAIRRRRDELRDEAPDTGSAETSVPVGAVLERWNIAGAVSVARVRELNDNERSALVARDVLNASGGITGIAMSGKGIGAVTPKDVFTAATGMRAKSYRLPYQLDLPVDVGVSARVNPRSFAADPLQA